MEKHLEPREEITPERILKVREKLSNYGEVELGAEKLEYRGTSTRMEIRPGRVSVYKPNGLSGEDWKARAYIEENFDLEEI